MFVLILLELSSERAHEKALPLVNVVIILVNIASYLLMCLFGWYWVVGPGTGVLSLLLYGFSHGGFWHLVFNMWTLWIFGNPVNRRLGNAYYLLAYLGTIVALGLLARLCYLGPVLGASGGIFAIIAIAAMLLPAARLKVAYGAVFPLSVLIGLIRKPTHGIYWFLCGGQIRARVLWWFVIVFLLEILSLFWSWWTGLGSVWNLGHLLGMVCGVGIVLMLPTRITMPYRLATSLLIAALTHISGFGEAGRHLDQL